MVSWRQHHARKPLGEAVTLRYASSQADQSRHPISRGREEARIPGGDRRSRGGLTASSLCAEYEVTISALRNGARCSDQQLARRRVSGASYESTQPTSWWHVPRQVRRLRGGRTAGDPALAERVMGSRPYSGGQRAVPASQLRFGCGRTVSPARGMPGVWVHWPLDPAAQFSTAAGVGTRRRWSSNGSAPVRPASRVRPATPASCRWFLPVRDAWQGTAPGPGNHSQFVAEWLRCSVLTAAPAAPQRGAMPPRGELTQACRQ